MHTDEAILGTKLADYWQSGHFQYDPKDFHGPALHQSAIAWGKLTGWGDPSTWTEADLRFVAVLCGLGVMLCVFLFADVLGRLGTALALMMTAVSP
jgi:predicted membrane-bound mannosyltransferase